MISVEYDHEVPYGHDPDGRQYPRLTVTLSNPEDPEQAVDLDAYLDSGAERSLFNGALAPSLGIELLSGPQKAFQSVAGNLVFARLHPIRLSHDPLGSFTIEVGFSIEPLGRNLLGRDFFSLVQIGFRESRLILYLTASP